MQKALLFLFLLCGFTLFSQEEVKLKNKIKGKLINNYTGTVLIKTKAAVYGINPENQQIAWKNEALKKIDFFSYQEIPFTPYILFEKKPLINSSLLSNAFGAKGVSRVLFNVTTGKVLFNSEKEGFVAVNNTLLIPDQKAVLVDGIKNDELVIGLYNYETGNQLWETKLTHNNFYKRVKGSLFDKEQILLDTDQNIIWLKNRHLFKIDRKTGTIAFEQNGVQSITLNKDILFVFSNSIKLKKLNTETAITALSAQSMTEVWKTPVTILGNLVETVIDTDKLIAITSKGFNIINTETGEKHWEKSESLPLIKKITPVIDGYLVVQEKFLTKVNAEGKKVWENPVRIGYSSSETPIHIFSNELHAMYLTPSFINVVTLEDGTKIWAEDLILNDADFFSRNLKLDEQNYQVWYDETQEQFPVYNDNELYIFNSKATEIPSSLYTFDFGREIPALKIREKGYFLHQNNRFYLFDTSGGLTYKKEYASIQKKSFFNNTLYWGRRGLITYNAGVGFVSNQINEMAKSVLISQDIGFATGTVSSLYGTYNDYKSSMDKYKTLNSLGLGSNLENIFYRLKKEQEDNNAMIIVVPNSADETNQILRLDIDSGKEENIMVTTSNQSDFIIDQIVEIIYSFGKKTIVITKI